jgi:hypothetical protein
VNIGKEPYRILLDACNFETSASVHSVRKDSGFEWTSETPDTVPDIFIAGHGLWVGKCNPGWSRSIASGLVDVGCSGCRRLVLSAESVERDVVTNCIGLRIDTKIVCPRSSG